MVSAPKDKATILKWSPLRLNLTKFGGALKKIKPLKTFLLIPSKKTSKNDLPNFSRSYE